MYPHRIERVYCSAVSWGGYQRNYHHQAFNITEKTLEFRLFPSPKSIEVLWFRIELLRIMLNNPRTETTRVIDDIIDSKSELGKLLRRIYKKDKLMKLISLSLKYSFTYKNAEAKELVEYSIKKRNSPEDYIVDMAIKAIIYQPTRQEKLQSGSV